MFSVFMLCLHCRMTISLYYDDLSCSFLLTDIVNDKSHQCSSELSIKVQSVLEHAPFPISIFARSGWAVCRSTYAGWGPCVTLAGIPKSGKTSPHSFIHKTKVQGGSRADLIYCWMLYILTWNTIHCTLKKSPANVMPVWWGKCIFGSLRRPFSKRYSKDMYTVIDIPLRNTFNVRYD